MVSQSALCSRLGSVSVAADKIRSTVSTEDKIEKIIFSDTGDKNFSICLLRPEMILCETISYECIY